MLNIRTMSPGEITFAVELAAGEGWNPGLHDGGVFQATDNDGFLIGELDGQPVGCISAVSYRGRFGFIGFYIVVPGMRGRGLGLQLWNAAMARLDGHNIGLDGVVAQQDNYRQSGFRLCHRNIRFEHTPAEPPDDVPAHVVPVDDSMRGAIDRYDRLCFPESRERFLDGWLTMADATALAWMENGRLRGYGVLRKCLSGCKVGPLFANDAEIAEGLYAGLRRRAAPAQPVYLDVPEINADALDMAQRHDMTRVFETARMYTGEPPAIDLDKVFGVTTFELG